MPSLLLRPDYSLQSGLLRRLGLCPFRFQVDNFFTRPFLHRADMIALLAPLIEHFDAPEWWAIDDDEIPDLMPEDFDEILDRVRSTLAIYSGSFSPKAIFGPLPGDDWPFATIFDSEGEIIDHAQTIYSIEQGFLSAHLLSLDGGLCTPDEALEIVQDLLGFKLSENVSVGSTPPEQEPLDDVNPILLSLVPRTDRLVLFKMPEELSAHPS